MVSETAEVNSASSKGIFVASPSTTVTFVFCMRRRSGAAKIGSSSKQVSRSLRARSSSVVNPGPGPIYNTFLPRSTSSRTRGNTSFTSVRFQRFEEQIQWCMRFIGFHSAGRLHCWGLGPVWSGMLTSRTGLSMPPGCAGDSSPSVSK